MEGSIKRRLIDFGMTLLFLGVYLQFYTLVKMNLHDIDGKKEFVACFFFPAIVALYSLIRLVKTPYPESVWLVMFASGGDNSRDSRQLSSVISVFVLAIVLYLAALALIDKGYMTAGYTSLEYVASVLCALLLAGWGTYLMVKKMKHESSAGRGIVVPLVFLICAAGGWFLGTGVRVLYEMIFLYPEVLRW